MTAAVPHPPLSRYGQDYNDKTIGHLSDFQYDDCEPALSNELTNVIQQFELVGTFSAFGP